MRIAIICFTGKGREIAEKIADGLRRRGHCVTLDVKCRNEKDSIRSSLSQWTKKQFASQEALIFVGAVGIAVRGIAPYIKSKTEDPAVLVADEQGRYCIPILSGHIGGANKLAEEIAAWIRAEAVITTATDLRQIWAVDVFAAKNNLWIQDMKKAKEISAKLLAGETIQIAFQGGDGVGIPGETISPELMPCSERLENDEKAQWETIRLPEGLEYCATHDMEPDVYIGCYTNPAWKKTLYLVPKAVVAGIGCRRGTPECQIEEAVSRVLARENILPESVWRIATIDRKAEETGILEYCQKHQLELSVYNAEELQRIEGDFTASDFVKQTVGVDNVCERSAVCGSHQGKLIVRKQACDGVTVALAQREWRVQFE